MPLKVVRVNRTSKMGRVSTAVEHLTYYPKVKGSNAAGRRTQINSQKINNQKTEAKTNHCQPNLIFVFYSS